MQGLSAAEKEMFRLGAANAQVDALELIGQLLDHMNAPIKPEPKPRVVALRRDWFEEDSDEYRNLKTA